MWQMIWKPCLPNEGSRDYEKALEGKNTCIIFKEKNEEELERKIIESTEHKHVDAFLCSNNIIAFQVLQAIEKTWKAGTHRNWSCNF